MTDNGVVGVFGDVGLGGGQFSYPRGIAAAPDGRIFVVDKAARVQRFNAAGTFECVWHMPEKDAGKPVGLAVHPDGRVFMADTHYHRVIVYDRDGHELARFGEPGRGPGQFEMPTDVAFDAEGVIYVSEYGGNDRITRWSPEFQYLGAMGEEPIEGRRLSRPSGIAFDAEQTMWVADACNHRIVRFGRDGQVLTAFGEMGKEPGQMRYPYDLAVTVEQTLLVCEYGNCRLQRFDRQGHSLGTWGGPGRHLGRLSQPWGAAIGTNGRVYVVDSYNSRVQIVRP